MSDLKSPAETSPQGLDGTAELLRTNQALRAEADQLRKNADELQLTLANLRASQPTDADSPRATSKVSADAVQSTSAERRRAEDALFRAADSNAFRLALSDALRPLSDPSEIKSTALRLLGRHFHVSRVTYYDLSEDGESLVVGAEYVHDLEPLRGRMFFRDYDPGMAEWLRAGRPIVVDDVRSHPAYLGRESAWEAISVRAYLMVPLSPAGKLSATLSVCQSTARAWTTEEISLIEETADRTSDAITRAEAQQALRASEERHRIALEGAGMGAWDYDISTDRVFWNAQHYRLFGLEPDHRALKAADFLHFVHPEHLAEVRERLSTSVETGGVYQAEFRVVRVDGVVRWMSGFGHAVSWEDRKVARMSGVMFDVTERHEAEETLAAAQERLRLVVESAHEHAIVSLDKDRLVTTWNPGAERIFGYTAAEIIGRSLDIIYPAEDQAAGLPEKEAQLALAHGRAGDTRWLLRKGGVAFWGSCAMLPMRPRLAGDVIGFVKILHDETDVQQAKLTLERSREDLWTALQDAEHARAEAEAAGRAKDHFLAVLSHELRTPLTPIVMALRTLARRKDLPAAVSEAHEMIQRNVEMEAHFIDDLLDVTRISHGKLEIVREPTDLHEAALRAVEVSTPDIDAMGQTLTVALEAAEYRLEGDRARLQQTLWNLLKNASKFTPKGGAIALRSYNEPPGRIVLEVTDSGIGLDQAALARIFNPFEQADRSITREYGGLGLGLAIAKAAVEAHGGQLGAESLGPGQGAKFTLSLSLAERR